MRRLALLALFSSTAAWAQNYSVAGVLLNADGRPAKRLRVYLAPAYTQDQQLAVLSGDNGSFRFDKLPAGKFTLAAENRGIGSQPYGLRAFSKGFGTAIVTGPDQVTTGLVFRLIAPAAIHGRVTDADGEPAETVLVQVFASVLVRGRRKVIYRGSEYTNDLGEYRFSGVPDGVYYLAVAGKPWYTASAQAKWGPLAHAGYGVIYYPNTRDPRSATPLEVKPGQDVAADFVVAPVPSVTVTAKPKVPGPGSSRLTLVREGIAGSPSYVAVLTGSGQSPSTIQGVQPGKYTLKASLNTGTKTLYATQSFVVGNQDVEIEIPYEEMPVVSGSVKLQDGSPPPGNTYVVLNNETERTSVRRAVSADGSFQFPGVPPGTYNPIVVAAAKILPVSSFAIDGSTVNSDEFELVRPVRVDLTASTTGGEIQGVVYRDGKPVGGVLAVLTYAKASKNPHDYIAFETDGDGSFEWKLLPPGEYVVLVKEDWYDLEYSNPDAVRPLRQSVSAVKITGTEVQKIRIELK